MSNPDRLVIFSELKPIYGINYTRVHLLRLEKAGTFPRRIVLSSRRVAWSAKELNAWVQSQIQRRDRSTEPAKQASEQRQTQFIS